MGHVFFCCQTSNIFLEDCIFYPENENLKHLLPQR